jgi:hypothetical protein
MIHLKEADGHENVLREEVIDDVQKEAPVAGGHDQARQPPHKAQPKGGEDLVPRQLRPHLKQDRLERLLKALQKCHIQCNTGCSSVTKVSGGYCAAPAPAASQPAPP